MTVRSDGWVLGALILVLVAGCDSGSRSNPTDARVERPGDASSDPGTGGSNTGGLGGRPADPVGGSGNGGRGGSGTGGGQAGGSGGAGAAAATATGGAGIGGTGTGSGGAPASSGGQGGTVGTGGAGGIGPLPPTTWAQWPVPNSPTDVMSGAPHPAAFKNNGDDTVTDLVTGLMWQRTVSITTYSIGDAVTHCQKLRTADHADWRAPSAMELLSLVDHDRVNPAIDPQIFPDTPPERFMTTTVFGAPPVLWTVEFKNGEITYDPNFAASARGLVRCVR